jgi:Mn2+/Fe2+ NRAMP family transporter
VNRKTTTALAGAVALLISGLNLFLLGQTFGLA